MASLQAKKIFSHPGVASVYADVNGYIISASGAFTSITGYTMRDVKARQMTYTDLLCEDDRMLFLKRQTGLAQDAVFCDMHRIIAKDGSERYVLYCQVDNPDEEGQIEQAILTNLTELRTPRFLAVDRLESLPCGVVDYFVMQDEGKIAFSFHMANKAYFDLIGIDPSQCEQPELEAIMSDADHSVLEHTRLRAINAPRSFHRLEVTIATPSGEIPVSCQMIYLEDPRGRSHLLCTLQSAKTMRDLEDAFEAQSERINLIAMATGEYLLDYQVDTDELTMTHSTSSACCVDVTLEHYLQNVGKREVIHPDDLAALLIFVRRLTQSPGQATIDIRATLFGEGMQWIRLQCSSLSGTGDKVHRIVGRAMNIRDQKKNELALQERAERDALTELYNRGTAQLLIDDFLAAETEKKSEALHAMLMIDLDDFKQINDQLSHAFGDAVLSEVASIIQNAFRREDIVSRIGGDEFVALIKHIDSETAIEVLSKRLCDLVDRTFEADGKELRLSISIGIALYPQHGKTFDALYHAADIANYHAKAKGKNQHFVYAGDNSIQYHSQRDAKENEEEINTPGPFKDNLEHFLLRILNDGDNRVATVCAALELLAQHFHLQRAYIMQYTPDGEMQATPYRWYEEGYSFDYSVMDSVPKEELSEYYFTMESKGRLVLPTLDSLPKNLREAMALSGAKSMIQYKYMEMGRLQGLIGFDSCISDVLPLDEEQLGELIRLARILAIFALQGTPVSESTSALAIADWLNMLPTYAYLVDQDTHEVLFVNRAFLKQYPNTCQGCTCYETIFQRTAPCEECPMKNLDPALPDAQSTAFMKTSDGQSVMKVTASWQTGQGGRRICFFNAADVTEYHT